MRRASAFLLLSSLTGCAGVPAVDRYLADHPEVPPAMVRAMREGVLAVGMSQEEVLAMLGTPSHATEAVGSGAEAAVVWSYPAGRAIRYREASGVERRYGSGVILDFRGGLLARARDPLGVGPGAGR